MRTVVKSGDILDEDADVLVCSANVHLNLSGGVNGAILLRGGRGVQQELHDHLRRLGRAWVEPGTVVRTEPGPLRVRYILHAVAVDGFYGTGVPLVTRTLRRALTEAAALGAHTVALAALATGYGRLPMRGFAEALRLATAAGRDSDAGPGFGPIEEVRVVVRHDDEADLIRSVLSEPSLSPGGTA